MLIKTPESHLKFIHDISTLLIQSKSYNQVISEYSNEQLLDIRSQNLPYSVGFFGSYFTKPMGRYFSDIDIVQYVNLDDKFFLRFFQILENLKKSKIFKLIRVYCGYRRGLEIPWDLQSDKKENEGSCDFSISKLENLFRTAKEKYPNIYSLIKPYQDKHTLSIKDVLDIENILKPVSSILWTFDEILKRRKMVDGVMYDFKKEFINYPMYRVVKFLYKYGNKDKVLNSGDWCMIDVNFRTTSYAKSSIKRDFTDIIAFYENDTYKKFKNIKKYLGKQATEEYVKEFSSTISHITPLAGRIEMINRIKKFKLLDEKEIDSLENDAIMYANKNNIPTIDYNQLQQLIRNKTLNLYDKFRPKIEKRYRKNFFIYEARLPQFTTQNSKETLRKKEADSLKTTNSAVSSVEDCPFFLISVRILTIIYHRSVGLLLNPLTVLNCIETHRVFDADENEWDADDKDEINEQDLLQLFRTKNRYMIERGDKSQGSNERGDKSQGSNERGPIWNVVMLKIFRDLWKEQKNVENIEYEQGYEQGYEQPLFYMTKKQKHANDRRNDEDDYNVKFKKNIQTIKRDKVMQFEKDDVVYVKRENRSAKKAKLTEIKPTEIKLTENETKLPIDKTADKPTVKPTVKPTKPYNDKVKIGNKIFIKTIIDSDTDIKKLQAKYLFK